MVVLEEAKICSMTENEVMSIIKKASDVYAIKISKVYIEMSTLNVIVLLDGSQNYYSFVAAIRGYLTGYCDEDFEEKQVELDIYDDICPNVQVVDSEELFNTYVEYGEGTVYEEQ